MLASNIPLLVESTAGESDDLRIRDCLGLPGSLKKVLKASSPPPMVLSWVRPTRNNQRNPTALLGCTNWLRTQKHLPCFLQWHIQGQGTWHLAIGLNAVLQAFHTVSSQCDETVLLYCKSTLPPLNSAKKSAPVCNHQAWLLTKMKSIVIVDAQAISPVTNGDATGTDDRLRAEQLPASVADLDARLPAVCSVVSLVSSCAPQLCGPLSSKSSHAENAFLAHQETTKLAWPM